MGSHAALSLMEARHAVLHCNLKIGVDEGVFAKLSKSCSESISATIHKCLRAYMGCQGLHFLCFL